MVTRVVKKVVKKKLLTYHYPKLKYLFLIPMYLILSQKIQILICGYTCPFIFSFINP